MKFKSQKKNGFTLIEIIITFSLVLALILGISSVVLSGMNINVDSEKKQSGNQYAQQILEKLISIDEVKTLSGNSVSGYKLKFDNVILSSDTKDSYSVLDYNLDKFNISGIEKIDKGYTADITITKNISGIGTTASKNDNVKSSNEYTLYVVGKGNKIALKEDKNAVSSESLIIDANKVKVLIDINTKDGEKNISINDSYSSSFFNDDPIIINLDFSEYDLNNKDLNFEIVVSNKDTETLNLCLQDSDTLKTNERVKVTSKAGQVYIYDNRVVNKDSDVSRGELYDISIKLKSESGEVYEKTVSRNLIIQDESN